MSKILLECPECQECFDVSIWFESYKGTNELLEAFTGIKNPLPEDLTEQEMYNFLLEEGARMDCPDCREVCCIEDMCEV